MRTSTGLMVTALALYSDLESPLGVMPGQVEEPEGLGVEMQGALAQHWAELERREALRPDRNVAQLYDGLRDLEARG